MLLSVISCNLFIGRSCTILWNGSCKIFVITSSTSVETRDLVVEITHSALELRFPRLIVKLSLVYEHELKYSPYTLFRGHSYS